MDKETESKARGGYPAFWKPSRILLLWRAALPAAAIFLLIEFYDELYYGVTGAVLPAVRTELSLSYAEVGLLFGVPGILSSLVEPLIFLLGDTGLRRRLIVGGGLLVALSAALYAASGSFIWLLLAAALSYPASGAFVSLSQATLVDLNPGREAQMVARWDVAGSLGALAGPLLASAGFALALGWRPVLWLLAGMGLLLSLLAGASCFPSTGEAASRDRSISAGDLWGNLRTGLRSRALLRWTLLLQLSDLLLDVFNGYAVLYFADVYGLAPGQTGLLLSGIMLAGLLSDVVLIPLLERIPGRALVRASAAVSCILYPLFLLAPWLPVKIGLALLVSFATMGWYPVLKGEAFAAAPGRSATVEALNSLAGVIGGALVWLVGWTAGQAGLPAAMWLLLAAPAGLLLFVPRD